MPKIARFYQLGGPEKLVFEEAPSARPGQGEVRLRVQAVGLNRAEALYLRGLYLERAKLPSRIGYEAAGIVEEAGPGVDRSWVGKPVATIPAFSMSQYGVLGEEAIVPADALGEYPPKLSPAEAAAIWMQYLTSYGALKLYGNLQAGDFVIITAASSSVGIAAIQMTKSEGAIAIATTRTRKKSDTLLALGADHVIASEEEELPTRINQITRGKGARVIFDAVAGPLLEKLAQAAAPGGIIFEYGALSLQPTPFPLTIALRKGLCIRGYTVRELRDPEVIKAAKQYIYDRLQDGRFVPKIAKTFPLAQAVDAYKYLESSEQIGKIVVTV